MANTDSERHYGMDWLRIGAFQLLILYHCGMAFVSWSFAIKLVNPAPEWAVMPMFLTNPWRLSLLFVVSGYASAALLSRSENRRHFLASRMWRLGIPLLFGVVVLVTPQPWIELVTQHGYRGSFAHFYLHDYYSFHAIEGVKVPTWMHLWFVAYLIVYTQVLGLLLRLPQSWREGAARAAERVLAGPLLLILPIPYLYVVRAYLPPGFEDTHAVVDDWSAHATYLPMFLIGILLRHSERLRGAIGRQWPLGALIAVAAYGFLAWCEIEWPGEVRVPDWVWPAHGVARMIECWGAIVGLIGFADAHLNRDHRWRPMLAEAVFPFYIIHQTIILLAGYWLLGTDTGGPVRFVILVVATFAGCWAFYLIGRAMNPLRPLIGLKRRQGARTVPAGPALV